MMDRVPRLLMEVLTEPPKGGQSMLGTIKIVALPIAKVFTMCFLGLLMASKCVNILPSNGRKLLNGLVFSLLLPCLIFSQLGQAITFEKMIQWWFIPVNDVIASITGSITGFIVSSIVRPPYPYFKFTVVQIGIDSCLILGEAMIPCILLALGGNLVDGPREGSANIGARTTAAIVFGRLCLVPPTGLGIATLTDKLGFLPPGDKKCSNLCSYSNTQCLLLCVQVLSPIYKDVGRRQHPSCFGFTFLLFSLWLVGLFFTSTYYFEMYVQHTKQP